MADIATNLAKIDYDMERIAANIEATYAELDAKGATMPAVRNSANLPACARSVTGGGGGGATSDTWVRPADRPTPPTIAENEQVVYELFGVSQDPPNDNAFRMTTSSGQYQVDWGDGTVENYNSNITAEHLYDFDSIAAPVGSEGYKWVWIKVTPLTGNLTGVNFHQYRHSLRPAGSISNIFIPQVFEIYMRGSEINSLPNEGAHYTHLHLCDIFYFYGTHKISALTYFCYNYYHLKRLIADVNNATTDFMSNCHSYNQPFPAGVTFSNVTTYFMYQCSSYNQPFPAGVTFSSVTVSFMRGCYSYNQPFPAGVTFSSVTTYFMYACYSYNQPFSAGVTFSNVTTYFMSSCHSYNQPFPAGVTFSKAVSDFMVSCSSYNQPFPAGVTFSKVTTNVMRGCSSYNQPFPAGVTFSNVTTYFMYQCSSYNQPLKITLQNTTAVGTNFLGSCRSLKSIRLLNMETRHTALNFSNTSIDVPALVALFGDLCDRTSTTAGTLTITNCYGASRLTTEQRAIATSKNWTLVG